MVQEHRQKARNADHDALVERAGIDGVLVAVGVPKGELAHVIAPQFGNHGHHGTGVERDAKHVGFGVGLTLQRKPFARCHQHDALAAKVGPEQAGAHEAVERRNDQPVYLFIAVIGERKGHPAAGPSLVFRKHFNAVDHAIGVGRGRHLDGVAVALVIFDGAGKVDGQRLAAHIHRFQRVCGVRKRAAKGKEHSKTKHKCVQGRPTDNRALHPTSQLLAA